MVVSQSEQCLEHNLYDTCSSQAKQIHWYSCMNNQSSFLHNALIFHNDRTDLSGYKADFFPLPKQPTNS